LDLIILASLLVIYVVELIFLSLYILF